MDRFNLNSLEKQTIYQIFRACRLCGAGGGFKMPIIQNVVDMDETDVELKQKIRDCVQIEVHSDDKMPPLICELCVDKVNDFYEFLEMCQQTNKQTRLKLGLPPQNLTMGAPDDSGDCILGVTEPVFVNEESDDDKPLHRRSRNSGNKSKNSKSDIAKASTKIEKAGPKIATGGPKSAKPGPKSARPGPKSMKTDVDLKKDTKTECTRPVHRDSSSSSSSAKPASRKMPASRELRDLSSSRSPSPLPKRVTRHAFDSPPAPPVQRERVTRLSQPFTEVEENAEKSLVLPKRESRLQTKASLKEIPALPDDKVLPTASKAKKRSIDPAPSRPVVPPKKVNKISVSRNTERATVHGDSLPAAHHQTQRISTPKSSPSSSISSTPASSPTVKTDKPNWKAKPTSKEPPTKAVSDVRANATKSGPKSMTKSVSAIDLKCVVCKVKCASLAMLLQHCRQHSAQFTSVSLACNACEDWFSFPTEAEAHHKEHEDGKPYHCNKCDSDFYTLPYYDEHFCITVDEVPDEQCDDCWQFFPTQNLLKMHQCWGEDGRPGGKCDTCRRSYETVREFREHERFCVPRTEEGYIVDLEVQKHIKRIQIRLARCDTLLTRIKKGDRYDVSRLRSDFGFDINYYYPYRPNTYKSFKVNQGPMVDIKAVKLPFDESFAQWDSDNSDNESGNESQHSESLITTDPKRAKRISSLADISLKSIFDGRKISKIPKRFRKVKFESTEQFLDMLKAFDTVDLKSNINNLIGSLDEDDANTCESNDAAVITENESTNDSKTDSKVLSLNDNELGVSSDDKVQDNVDGPCDTNTSTVEISEKVDEKQNGETSDINSEKMDTDVEEATRNGTDDNKESPTKVGLTDYKIESILKSPSKENATEVAQNGGSPLKSVGNDADNVNNDMDDKQMRDALDAQIEKDETKSAELKDDVTISSKPMDLDSISDEEFDFNA